MSDDWAEKRGEVLSTLGRHDERLNSHSNSLGDDRESITKLESEMEFQHESTEELKAEMKCVLNRLNGLLVLFITSLLTVAGAIAVYVLKASLVIAAVCIVSTSAYAAEPI